MSRAVHALAVLVLAGCATLPNQPHLPAARTIDAEARRLMQREGVRGLALAVIEDGRVAHVAAYGRRNVKRDLPLTTDTVMYGASLTKTAFAYMVLQLVDEGRLDLDASVADLLPRPLPEYPDYTDLAGDERWRALTPRIILNHTSGFANFRWLEDDEKLRFHHAPGSRYGYSGEGFYVLQLILEEGLGLDVGKEMQTRVFHLFGMTNTSMAWRPDFAANLADGSAGTTRRSGDSCLSGPTLCRWFRTGPSFSAGACGTASRWTRRRPTLRAGATSNRPDRLVSLGQGRMLVLLFIGIGITLRPWQRSRSKYRMR